MQKYLKNSFLYCILLIAAAFAGCGGPKVPDVSHIPINVTVERFDEKIFRLDTNRLPEALHALDSAWPAFTPVYFSGILGFGHYDANNPEMLQKLRNFTGNKDFRALQDSVEAHFKDMRPLEASLTHAFRLTKHYIPSFKAPRVVTFMSAIGSYGAVTVDSTLGIGLDMYMGADFPIYRLIPDYPEYMIRKFAPEYIPVNVMKVLELGGPRLSANPNLLEQMVAMGVKQYLLEKTLPETPAYIRLGYTKEQWSFCEENEGMIWQYLIQNKLLYSTDDKELARYVEEGPSTQGMPREAPGQIGAFVGYRIIQTLAEKHPEYTLEKLVSGRDNAIDLFNKSKYKPR
ncbi:gliding motility lipoprotein GldB [Chitinophaga lutea]